MNYSKIGGLAFIYISLFPYKEVQRCTLCYNSWLQKDVINILDQYNIS